MHIRCTKFGDRGPWLQHPNTLTHATPQRFPFAAFPELPQDFLKPVVVIELGAFAIRVGRLLEILPHAESLRRALKADAERLTFQVQQWADCDASHPIEARLAGLLLRAADCIGGHRIALTPDEVSQMLGVQETTVCSRPETDGESRRPGLAESRSCRNRRFRFP